MIINTYKYSYNLPVIISRCNNVYGKYQFVEKVIPCFILNAINNSNLPIQGDGSKVRDFILYSKLVVIIEKGNIGEIYNIGNDNPIKILDLANIIIDKIGKGKVTFIKDRPFNDNRYYVNSNKLESLGWTTTMDFDKGINEVIEWIKETHDYWLSK